VPFDEGLAQRIREHVEEAPGVSEKRMFGGLAFLVNGNMAVGVVKSELMVRVGPDEHAAALREPHARPMDFTGRPMKGFVFVAEAGVEDDDALARWVRRGVLFAASLARERAGRATPRAPSSSARRRSRG
jgi:TfoX/Sxy family transcriptional regulator of competence genes